jgi:hypothetical protein
LLEAQIISYLGETRIIFLFDDKLQQDVFALQDGIPFKLPAPESRWMLQGNQAVCRAGKVAVLVRLQAGCGLRVAVGWQGRLQDSILNTGTSAGLHDFPLR